jgi:acetyl esterase/lipase
LDNAIRKRIRQMGPVMGPEIVSGSMALFAPLALRPTPDICSVERDVFYGPDQRHRLNIFRPASGGGPRPIVVYIHGGGFIGGDKGAETAPFYNNVGAWAAKEGYLGVTMTYRLAPAYPWPAGAEDVARAVSWLIEHGAGHGGDPSRIFLIGQSAGAAHIASFLAAPRLHGRTPPVAGAIMFSGIYDVVRLKHGPFENAYYGTDPSRFAEQSSLSGLIETEIPCLFTAAEYDPPLFQTQTALLAEAWFAAKSALPHLLYLPDGNHMSAALSIGTGDALEGEIAAFIGKHGEGNA